MTLGKEKVHFLSGPTPLHRLDRISADLGVEFYLKRDDLTDFGTGGNKLRKLEYFLKDAMDQGATMLLTVGGAQTNHGRLTAAAAARCGMRSAIVAVDEYPGELSANLLLDGIMDCHVYLVQRLAGQSEGELLREAVKNVTEEWESRGEKVYYIPLGGSNELGALGYYDCALELAEQVRERKLDAPHVFTAVGSMGTYMGLAAAIAEENLPLQLTGIGVLPYEDIRRSVAKYYARVQEAYGLTKKPDEMQFDVTSDYDYGAYNNPVEDVRQAIYYMGRMEGIILDPCYTGKAFNAILRMIREGKIRRGETVIMIHTGGIPGIYTHHHRIEMEKELMEHIHCVTIGEEAPAAPKAQHTEMRTDPAEVIIRDAGPQDAAFILELNKVNVEVLSPMDREKYDYFLGCSDMFQVAEVNGEPAAFLIALREGLPDYTSENYIWFSKQYEKFLYVDRIVIDGKFRGMGIGRRIYEGVFRRAAESGLSTVTAEIDIVPYNGPSLKFHEAMGFGEVGQQVIRGGEIKVSLQARDVAAMTCADA